MVSPAKLRPNTFMACLVKGRTPELRRILDLLLEWLERRTNRIHQRRRQAFGSSQRPQQRRQTHLRGRSSEPCGRSTVTMACHHCHATRKSCVCPDRRQSWGSRAHVRRRSQLWLGDDPRAASAKRSLPDSSTEAKLGHGARCQSKTAGSGTSAQRDLKVRARPRRIVPRERFPRKARGPWCPS
jgi:hypothetical protein